MPSMNPLRSSSAVDDLKRLTPWASALALLAVAGGGACDLFGPECRYFNDCPSGQECSADNVCVAEGPTPEVRPSPGVTPTPSTPTPDVDGGPQEPDVVTVQTQFPVAWIEPIAGSTTKFYFSQFAASGETVSVDQVKVFNTETERVESPAEFDLIDAVDGPCTVNNLRLEPTLTDGETWMACDDGLRIYYALNQAAYYPGIDAQEGYAVTPSRANDDARRLWFERGGDILTSFVIRPPLDAIYSNRLQDTFEGVSFTQIVGVFQIDNQAAIQGETLFVVDRADPQLRLVPLQHDSGTNILRDHSSLTVRSYGDKAHTLEVIGPINALAQPNPGNVANIMVFEPENGIARYYKAENGEEVLPVTQFEPSATYRAPRPDPDARMLHVFSPDRTAIFYTIPGVPKVWRVPITPGSDNDVTFFILNDANADPTGVFPISEEFAWVSTSTDNLLIRVKFQGIGG